MKPALYQLLRELQSHMFCLLTIIQSHIIHVVSGDVIIGLQLPVTSELRFHGCDRRHHAKDRTCFVRHVTSDYHGYTRKEKEIRVGLSVTSYSF